MATITITNAAKPVPACMRFTFGYAGTNNTEIGIVDYIDCDGVARQLSLTWEESNGNYYETNICALEIPQTNSFATDVTNYQNQQPCTPINCIEYVITTIIGSGNAIIGTYTDCSGVTQNLAVYGTPGNNEARICAQENSIKTTEQVGTITPNGSCGL